MAEKAQQQGEAQVQEQTQECSMNATEIAIW